MEFDFQTIAYACGAIFVIIAGLFVGLWIFGILVVGGLVCGGYLYIQNANEDKAKAEQVEQVEAYKSKVIEEIEKMGNAM